jgi:TonB family protein
MRKHICAIVSAACLATAAAAQDQPAAWRTQEPLTGVEWEVRPSGEDFARHYPPEAMRDGVSGSVVLDCLVRGERTLQCEILSETPEDAGFGVAALRISEAFIAAPETRDGARSIGGRVRLPIRFNIAGPPVPPNARVLPRGADLYWESGMIQRYYPEAARAAGVEGRVVLDCVINERLRFDCTVRSEDPSGWGFGQAALDIQSNFFLRLSPGEHSPAGERRTIPIHFREQR